jgi:hypothetical protein
MNHFFDNPKCVDHTDENIKKIPKRVKGPVPNEEPVVWGLEAVHGTSVAMIVLVWFLIAVACACFMWWWLKEYPGDLGGAAGPPAVLVSWLAVGLVLLQMHRSREYGKQSG